MSLLLRLRGGTGPVAYELDAQPGEFAVSGAVAGAVAGRELDAQPGAVALAGVDAGLEHVTGPQAYELDAQPGAYALAGVAAGLSWSGEPVEDDRFTFHGTFGGLRKRWRTIAGRRHWVTDDELDEILRVALEPEPRETQQDAPDQRRSDDRASGEVEIAAAELRAAAARQLAEMLDAQAALKARYEATLQMLQDEVSRNLLQLEYERQRFELEDDEDVALLLLH